MHLGAETDAALTFLFPSLLIVDLYFAGLGICFAAFYCFGRVDAYGAVAAFFGLFFDWLPDSFFLTNMAVVAVDLGRRHFFRARFRHLFFIILRYYKHDVKVWTTQI